MDLLICFLLLFLFCDLVEATLQRPPKAEAEAEAGRPPEASRRGEEAVGGREAGAGRWRRKQERGGAELFMREKGWGKGVGVPFDSDLTAEIIDREIIPSKREGL